MPPSYKQFVKHLHYLEMKFIDAILYLQNNFLNSQK